MAAEDGAVKGGTPFSDHVAKAGMTACSSGFPAMGASLAQNSRYMVETNWNKQDPNHHLLRALVGIRFDTSDYKGPAVGVLTAAPIDGACETSAVRVTPFEMSCDEVVRRFLGGRALAARLQDLPTYQVADGSQVMTMPIGKNCVAVSVAYSAGMSKNAH
jgi:hypothetical protein